MLYIIWKQQMEISSAQHLSNAQLIHINWSLLQNNFLRLYILCIPSAHTHAHTLTPSHMRIAKSFISNVFSMVFNYRFNIQNYNIKEIYAHIFHTSTFTSSQQKQKQKQVIIISNEKLDIVIYEKRRNTVALTPTTSVKRYQKPKKQQTKFGKFKCNKRTWNAKAKKQNNNKKEEIQQTTRRTILKTRQTDLTS